MEMRLGWVRGVAGAGENVANHAGLIMTCIQQLLR